MNISKLEENLESLVADHSEESFVYDLLLAYEQPKASITRLKKGDYNLSKTAGEVLWKKKLCFKRETESDLHGCIDKLKNDKAVSRHHPRFIIVTDFQTLLSVDTKTGDTLDTPIGELPKHFDFFLPWAGMEKSQLQSENPADIKAAERMGRLYDLILQDNPPNTDGDRHALNIFLSRLLFCFFAEDTEIFADGQFTNAVASHTAEDGSDLQAYLQRLFTVLSAEARSGFPEFLQAFPYVNGGLFADEHPVPIFNTKSRKIILECGGLNWKAINPDIFGSMIQSVVHHSDRGHLGIHYTSVVNIMKVIEPLFLNDLHAELEQAGNSEKKLSRLLERLYRLRIFDPACGSGNFLIIAYKELCKLEIQIFKRLYGDQTTFQFESRIQLTQFYGIEIDDFAHETAKLSLWLAEHQMNLAFKEVFGASRPTLPLQDGGHIVCGNATRLDWEMVCPKDEGCEIYVLGNPPYLGARNQNKEQKADLAEVFDGHKDYKDSDYVCCWYLKGVDYIHGANASLAFVSTNSICQGEQVGYLWPRILENAEIAFAHQSFKWTNNAKGNAGVTCVILGIRRVADKSKVIYSGGTSRPAKNISPYLHDGKTIIVSMAKKPLTQLPSLVMGNMPRDGGNLILSTAEARQLQEESPESSRFIKRYYGADEFLNSRVRWCLWITDEDVDEAKRTPRISERIAKVYKFRVASRAKTTRQYSSIPHKFAQRSYLPGDVIIVPSVSSERRHYIPFGFLDSNSIISNLAYAIYKPTTSLFAIISSRIHMTWVRTVAGRMKTDPRYTAALCYNPFPYPELREIQKSMLDEHALRILDERESHSEKTMAQLYAPDSMPVSLREAHHEMDLAVEQCYRSKPFRDDEERLRFLFDRYEQMIEARTTAETSDA